MIVMSYEQIDLLVKIYEAGTVSYDFTTMEHSIPMSITDFNYILMHLIEDKEAGDKNTIVYFLSPNAVEYLRLRGKIK